MKSVNIAIAKMAAIAAAAAYGTDAVVLAVAGFVLAWTNPRKPVQFGLAVAAVSVSAIRFGRDGVVAYMALMVGLEFLAAVAEYLSPRDDEDEIGAVVGLLHVGFPTRIVFPNGHVVSTSRVEKVTNVGRGVFLVHTKNSVYKVTK